MKARMTVLLADDHAVVREGYRRLLEESGRIRVVGEATNATDAIEQFARLAPGVVVMDISLPGMSGIEVARLLKRRHPRLGIPAWIDYVNGWAPKLLTHRDALLLSYRDLNADPGETLRRVLLFLNHAPDPALIADAVESGNLLRSGRGIRTGQEGNFWDHLQPDEIFDIQEAVSRGLSEFSVCLLERMGVEVDPFPREGA